jgi:hypothetical protein
MIENVISKSSVPEDPIHSKNTLEWLLKLEPNADESMQIAALGHDIERAMEKRKVSRKDFSDFNEFKDAHARNSAEILMEIMEDCRAPKYMTDEVFRLVIRHETGGDPKSDILRDSDGVSYFDVNLPLYYKRNGREETRRRSLWGYMRLSKRIKQVVAGLSYEKEEHNELLKEIISAAE